MPIGKVVSIKMAKTATVVLASKKVHPLYGKRYSRTKKYLAHDQIGTKEGDIVEIVKNRPVSRNKHWVIKRVLGRDIVSIEQAVLHFQSEEAISEVLPETKEELQSRVSSIAEKKDHIPTQEVQKDQETAKNSKEDSATKSRKTKKGQDEKNKTVKHKAEDQKLTRKTKKEVKLS